MWMAPDLSTKSSQGLSSVMYYLGDHDISFLPCYKKNAFHSLQKPCELGRPRSNRGYRVFESSSMAPSAFNHCFVIMVLAMMNLNLILMTCSAEEHVVGNDRGWDPASDFKGWASTKIFRVGDNLWFAYASSEHNVLELKSQEEFENCDLSNPIRLFDGGLDAVPLVEVGDRFFTSGNAQTCQSGMKVHINVVSDGMDKDLSDKFDVVSDGLDQVRKDSDLGNLLSDGLKKGQESVVLISDGMEHSFTTTGENLVKKIIVEVVAEGPTSSQRQLFGHPSYIINIALPIFGLVITVLIYAMI